jgi:hypothetical protein
MSQRISALEKAEYRLQSLQQKFVEQESVFISTQKKYRKQTCTLDTLLAFESENIEEKKQVKQQHNECSKQVTVIGNELRCIRKRIENAKRCIYVGEMEVAMIVADTRQTEEKKEHRKILKKLETGVFSDQLLKKITSLPDDIVCFIASFLPQDLILEIKIRELEMFTKTSALLGVCTTELQLGILNSFSTQREFLGLLSYEEGLSQITDYPEFRPYAKCSYTKEPALKIRSLIEMAKISKPEFAYDMLKKLHILIDPAKKYKKAEGTRTFNVLTFDDLNEVHYA